MPCLSPNAHEAYHGILISVFSLGYHGKTIDLVKYSPCHRTTVAHFLHKRKWDDARLEDMLKSTVVLSCNGIILNYAIVMYNKARSKVTIVQEIAGELPVPPVISYFLCDNWYTCGDIMDVFVKKGFYTIGTSKTNRILYPCGIKQKVSEFALHLRRPDADVSLVTVGSCLF